MTQIDRFTCQEMIERVNDYLDRELTPHEMQLVIEHLEVCAFCVREFQFEARLLQELQAKVNSLRPPEGLLDRVRSALAEAQGTPEGE